MGIYPEGDHFRVVTSKGKTSKISNLDDQPPGRAVALPGVIVRQFDAPLRKKRLLSTLPYQLDETLPYGEEDRLIFPQLRKGGATLFIGSNSALDQLIENTHPMWVSSIPSALFRYVKETFDAPDTGLFYFEGECEAFALDIEEGRLSRFVQLPSKDAKTRVLAFFNRDEFTEITDPYAIAHGLVLEAQAKDGRSVQFLSKAKRHPKIKREIRLKLLCVALLTLTLIGVSGYLMENHLKTLEANYETGVQKLSQEMPALKGKRSLSSMKKALKKQEKGKTLFEPPPKVTKLLAHLDPLLEGIEIVALETELEEYPTCKQMTQPYVMRVHLVFKTKSAMVAEAFHEVLMQGDDLIDQDKEVRWSRTSHGYETTFYLKS